MTTKKTSQSQQKQSTTHPAGAVFEKMAEENLARMEAFFDEMTSMHERSVEQTTTAIDEAAKLMKEQVNYGAKLATEWQRIAIESSRQAAEMFAKPWTMA